MSSWAQESSPVLPTCHSRCPQSTRTPGPTPLHGHEQSSLGHLVYLVTEALKEATFPPSAALSMGKHNKLPGDNSP